MLTMPQDPWERRTDSYPFPRISEKNRIGTPHRCPECAKRKDGQMFGLLVFDGDEVPTCPYHRRKRSDGTFSGSTPLLVPSSELP